MDVLLKHQMKMEASIGRHQMPRPSASLQALHRLATVQRNVQLKTKRMKRVLFILVFVVATILTYGGFASLGEKVVKQPRRSCTGYEVIEAGKGINCYGDTIKLTKKSGFYEVATSYNAR